MSGDIQTNLKKQAMVAVLAGLSVAAGVLIGIVVSGEIRKGIALRKCDRALDAYVHQGYLAAVTHNPVMLESLDRMLLEYREACAATAPEPTQLETP